MTPFFAYLIKSSISLALLYCLFRFVMRNDRNHALNRFLLLGILFLSAVIPFLNIQFFYEEVQVAPVEFIREFVSPPVIAEIVTAETVQSIPETTTSSVNPWLAIYFVIMATLLSRLFIAVFKVTRIIKSAEKQRFQKIVLAVVKEMIQPFSFFNKVVLSEKDFTENKDIVVAHEYAHIKQMHAIDLIFCELFTIVHFFNPFIWLLRRDLKLIHEYQADQAVLNKGIDAKKYQLLVLQKSVGERRFAMANHFTQKPILKRLKMMSKRNTKNWNAVKLFLFVPVLILLFQAFSRPELITNTDEFIPVKYQENKKEKWLSKWTLENIGNGFFQPGMKSENSPKSNNNILVILLNRRDQFLIENEYATKDQVKQIVKDFLAGKDRKGKYVVDYVEKEIPFIGKMKVPKGHISFRYDMDSSDEAINFTLRCIGEACLEARIQKAQILFGKNYFNLSDEKQEAVDIAVPIWFSTDEPKVTMKTFLPSPKVMEIIEMDESNLKGPAPTEAHGIINDGKVEPLNLAKNISSPKVISRVNNKDVEYELNLSTSKSENNSSWKKNYDEVVRDGDFYKTLKYEKIGLVDAMGREVLSNRFDALELETDEFDGNIGVTMCNGKLGIFDWGSSEIRHLEFDAIEFNGPYGWNIIDGKYGMINKKGQIIIPNIYDSIEFEGSYGKTIKNGKIGLLHISGKIVIPNEYDDVEFDNIFEQYLNNRESVPVVNAEPQKEKHEELKEEEAILNTDKIKSILESRQWVLEADRLKDRYGETEFANPTLNFVAVSDENVTIQKDLINPHGKRNVIGTNGVGGVTLDGKIYKYELKEGKKPGSGFGLTLMAKANVLGNLTIQYQFSPNGNAHATVYTSRGVYARYKGKLFALDESRVHKGNPF